MTRTTLADARLGRTTRNKLKEAYPNLPAWKSGDFNVVMAYQRMVEPYNREIANQIEREKNNSKAREAMRKKIAYSAKENKTVFDIDFEKFSSIKQAMTYLLEYSDKYYKGKPYVLNAGNVMYVVNANTRPKLYEAFTNTVITEDEQIGSDTQLITRLQDVPKIRFELYNPKNHNKRISGDFFKYTHNIPDLDLSRYQIYTEVNKKSDDEMFDSCLIHALRVGGMNNMKLMELSLFINTRNTPLSKLEEICDTLEIRIDMCRMGNGDQFRTVTYGEKYSEKYDIGLLDEHFFLIEMVPITLYALRNWKDVCKLPDWKTITRVDKKGDALYPRRAEKYINSFTLINHLLKDKETSLTLINHFQLLHTSKHTMFEKDIVSLDYQPKEKVNYKPIVSKPQSMPKKPNVNEYFDFETYTKLVGGEKVHTPYLCCVVDDNGMKRSFYGEDCGQRMLWYLFDKYKCENTVTLIAHNASYDIQFLYRYLYNVSEITRGTKVLSCDAKFAGMDIKIKDSYLLITMGLKKFPKTFKIKNIEKEVISYKMYNETDCIEKRYVDIDVGLDWIRKEGKDENQFKQNILQWKLEVDGKFDCIEYSRHYCEIDCEILRIGYQTFKKWMNELAGIDIDYVLTNASLAHTYFVNSGCYEGVYQLGGVPQAFIQKCVVGGRTMCANNQKYVSDKHIVDFDAVSLYPSAMSRMDGFLKGLPKIVDCPWEQLRYKDGYFVEIRITSVGKKRSFPLMSYLNDAGIRIFTNDMVGKIMYVDKITLEDMMQFQDITFDVIRGYYFDEGFNPKINEVIKSLFNERARLKAEKNPAQEVYKLIMNSGYGKSMMKEIEHEIRYFNSEEKMKEFVRYNYNWVDTITELSGCRLYKVKLVKSLSKHFNIAQVGVSILSWSKRIMNEVMCLAEDCKLPIYYQDTDSMHIDECSIAKLSNAFKKKYGRDLIGENLGQFHSDFELVDYKVKDEDGFYEDIKCKNIIATKSIFLGKKSYIDVLQGDTEAGGHKTDYHIRMKGIPNECIDWTWKNFRLSNPGYDRDLTSPYELYELLHTGCAVTFDLTQNGCKDNFKTHSSGYITTLDEFRRTLSFR